MSTVSADLERALDELLGPDPGDRLPDRVLATTFEQTANTMQRRSIGMLKRSPTTMSPLLRFTTVGVILALAIGGALVVGSQQHGTNLPPSTPPSLTPASPTPAVTATPTATPPRPSGTAPALTTDFASPSYGYAVRMPDGYHLDPASEAWQPYVETQMDSPWLETIGTDSNLATFTARSVALEHPLSSADWLTVFSNYPGSPVVRASDCNPDAPAWHDVTIDGEPAFQLHEPCGPFWLIVSKGSRGYVFTWKVNVNDEPELMAPYEALMAAVRETIHLTPETATSPLPSARPSS